MDDSKAAASFLGAPLGGLIVSLLAWQLFKTRDAPKLAANGSIRFGQHLGEHLGPWHSPQSAMVGITAICTLVSWLILGFVWVNGKS